MSEPTVDSVASLLARARAAHGAYRALASNRHTFRDYPACETHIRTALDARRRAHQLDTDQTDPAWTDDAALMKGQTSQTLTAFYEKYLVTA